MPDITQRIADILRGHRFDDSMPEEIFCHEREDSPMVGMKRGPDSQADWEEWVDHVAEVLTTELGLTQQWGWRLGDNTPSVYTSQEDARARVDELNRRFAADPNSAMHSALPRTVVSRYVTDWVRE